MSKNNVGKCLALSALMAFVITGSAYADTYEPNEIGTVTVNGNITTVADINSDVVNIGSDNADTVNIDRQKRWAIYLKKGNTINVDGKEIAIKTVIPGTNQGSLRTISVAHDGSELNIGQNGATEKLEIENDTKNYSNYTINAYDSGEINLDANEISIKNNFTTGVYIERKAKLNIGQNKVGELLNISAQRNVNNKYDVALYLDSNSETKIDAKKINLESGYNSGIRIYNNAKLDLGQKGETEELNITAGLTNANAHGVHVFNQGQAAIDAQNINIEAGSSGLMVYSNAQLALGQKGDTKELKIKAGTGNNNAIAIWVDSNSKAVVAAETINIEGGNRGIRVSNNAVGDIQGSLNITSPIAIDVANASTLSINSENAYTSIIEGNVLNSASELEISGSKVDLTGYVSTTSSGNTNINFGSGTWNLTHASTLSNASFGADSVLKVAADLVKDNYAITGSVAMDEKATVVINGYELDTTYKIVDGENNIKEANLGYDRTLYLADETTANGTKYEVSFIDLLDADGELLDLAQERAVEATGGKNLVAPGIIAGGIGSDALPESKSFVGFITKSGKSIAEKAAIVNDVAEIAEKTGATANTISIVNSVSGITSQRLSFTQMSTAPQGGYGKVERQYKSGVGVWAQYVHGKDKVEDIPTASGTNSYENKYNGAIIGYDFKEIGKTQSGIAFNYGQGDSHSVAAGLKTNNEFDFWGVSLYHSIMNDDTNLIFDVNYNKTSADVKQNIPEFGDITVNPDTTALSFGVKAEKLIQNGTVQIVPYIGARFLSIDTDAYTSSTGSTYTPERQNIWLLPVGVSLRQENVYDNGWRVTPRADLSYIWAMGDTDNSMNIVTGVKNDMLRYTVMDNGSFLGTIGIEATKADWTYGLSYSLQKGEYQRSDKWFVDISYSF